MGAYIQDVRQDDNAQNLLFKIGRLLASATTGNSSLHVEVDTPVPVSTNLTGVVSANNSSTSLLGGGGVFSGTSDDILNYAAIIVTVHSDQASATDGLKIYFSQDNAHWDISDVFTLAAGSTKTFTFQPVMRYFKIGYTNGATPQTDFHLSTQYRYVSVKSSSHRLADDISGQDDAELIKAVLAAEKPNGIYTNINATAGGNLKVSLEEIDGAVTSLPVSAAATAPLRTADATTRSVFGEPVMAQITPLVRTHFTYGLSSRKVSTALKSSGATIVASGGSVAPATTNGADLVVSIDNAANAFAVARSVRAVHYFPGMGQIARLTCAFNAGVANSRQFAGLWSPNAEWTVGYNGTVWGCFAKTAGAQAVYSLTITTAATSAADATVTLDGTAVTVPLTNQAGNPSRTAREIAAGSYLTAGQAGTWGWNAFALGATVYFVARRARAVAGAFSYSAGTTGSAAAGGMVEVRRGVAETLDFGSPTVPGNFTFLDPCDGTGVLPNLDKTKGIIYEIQAGHLGHRGCTWAIPDVRTGLPIPFCRYNYHNTATTSVMQNPTMWVANGIEAKGSTTAMTLRSGSWFGGVVGMVADDAIEGEPFASSAGKAAVNGTSVHYASVQGGPIAGFSGQIARPARTDLRIKHVTISVTGGSAGSYVDCSFVLNGTYTNLANFVQADANRLAAWKWEDTTTSTATLTAGTVISSPRIVTNAGTIVIPVDISLEAGETFGVNVLASATNLQADVSIMCAEIGG